jgi:hypothetical protein
MEPELQAGCALELREPPPQRAEWLAPLGALLRRECDGAVVRNASPHRHGLQLRVMFGTPIAREDAPAAVEAMEQIANDFVRRMREFEEDTTLADFERTEKAYREGVTTLQRALTVMAGAKSAAEFTAAATTLLSAAKAIASTVLPGMLP